MPLERLVMVLVVLLPILGMLGCAGDRSFAGDVDLLSKSTRTLVLSSPDGRGKVAVCPAFQGRVMTSTAAGDSGSGYGFLNDEVIKAGKPTPKITVFGGEDRFWLGPEGGQFAIFFEKGDKFTLDDWQTPAAIDSEPYTLVSHDASSAIFTHRASFTNYSGSKLDVQIDRTVRLVSPAKAASELGVDFAGTDVVAFESDNTITNVGPSAWTKQSGMLSVWILGMFKPGPRTTVVVPFKPGPEKDLGPIVNDAYFGKVPADRIRVGERAIFFKADGKFRSKIGVAPRRSLPICGSYDAQTRTLTLVTYTMPGSTDYVNSMWELQDNPFAGDVVNSYNDGGGLGSKSFYELETSSPAAALAPGGSIRHVHRTMHITGPEKILDAIASKALGVGLAEIKAALP